MPDVLRFDGCVMAMASADDDRAAALLTPSERREYLGLASESGRADYRASRLAAKWAIAHSCTDVASPVENRRLADISVVRRPGATPDAKVRSTTGSWLPADVTLTLSHRDGCGVAVTSRSNACVGVDVERAASIAYDHMRYFATAGERQRGPQDPASLWALKEAAWKAMALASHDPFSALELAFTDARELDGVRVAGRLHQARGYLLNPWGDAHIVALVIVSAA